MTASGNTLKKEYVNPITHGVIWKQLLLYFVPLLLSSFLQLCYNTADTIIVGRFVGKIALTAVGGSAGQIYAMVTEFMIGASGGAAVIMSQAYGARNKKLLDDGLHNAVALALAMGALFTVTGLLVSKTALVTAGAPAETMAGSLMYLRIACDQHRAQHRAGPSLRRGPSSGDRRGCARHDPDADAERGARPARADERRGESGTGRRFPGQRKFPGRQGSVKWRDG